MEKESVMNAYLIAPEKGLDTELEEKLYMNGVKFFKLSKKGLVKRKKEKKEVKMSQFI